MNALQRSHCEKIPFLGDMLFSILTFPIAFTFLEKWVVSPEAVDTGIWLGMLYITLGLVHLFRAFRLNGRSRSTFIAHLVYCVAFVTVGALSAFNGLTHTMLRVVVPTFMGCMLSERILDIARNKRPWRVVFNVAVMLLIIVFMIDMTNKYTMFIVGFLASLSSLLTVMILIFSRMRLDILKEIIRKTYAMEIIAGLLVMMVAFSNVLKFTDETFSSFWDALWYCFAIVTTIGFGDLTPATGTGRVLSVILGVYGIVVVALITSIIVNFYGELKKGDFDCGKENGNSQKTADKCDPHQGDYEKSETHD